MTAWKKLKGFQRSPEALEAILRRSDREEFASAASWRGGGEPFQNQTA
jgi:hypothetical protein